MLAARAGPRPEEEEIGFRRSDGEAVARFSVRAARRTKKYAGERAFHAGERFERTIEREFPAFGALQVRRMAFAHFGGQPRGDVAPELGLKLEFAVFHALNIRPRSPYYKR